MHTKLYTNLCKFSTKYFDGANAALNILDYALKNNTHWETSIADWQKTV
jgi:hypothetical protein